MFEIISFLLCVIFHLRVAFDLYMGVTCANKSYYDVIEGKFKIIHTFILTDTIAISNMATSLSLYLFSSFNIIFLILIEFVSNVLSFLLLCVMCCQFL